MRELAVVRSSERFEDFCAREFPAVVCLAAVLSGSRWAAEALAQEAFLAAHRDWERRPAEVRGRTPRPADA